jgi:hypothetical protein
MVLNQINDPVQSEYQRTPDSEASNVSDDASEFDEDFVTLDWAVHEEEGIIDAKRRAAMLESSPPALRYMLKLYDAMQGWIALTLIGCATGLLAAIVAIGSEWASDLKFGFCFSNNGFAHQFWITRKLCCKHTIGDDSCPDWRRWHITLGSLFGESLESASYPIDYACYTVVAVMQAIIAARLCLTLAPFASGQAHVHFHALFRTLRLASFEDALNALRHLCGSSRTITKRTK